MKADLLPIFIPDPRVFRPSVERSFGKYISGVFSYETGRYGHAQVDSNKTEAMETRGWSVIPEVRVYPFGKKLPAPLGFFAGPHYLYRRLEEHVIVGNLNVISKAQQQGFGINAGYKHPFLNRFCVDFLIGYTFASPKWKSSNGNRELIEPQFRFDPNNFKNNLRVELSVGIIFPKINNGKSEAADKRLKLKDAPGTLGDDDTSYAQLIIYRPKSFEGETVEYDLFVNDSLVTHLKNNSYFNYEVFKSGTYLISATTEDKVTAELVLQKGKVYYLECTVGAGTAVGLPKFKLVPEHKAEPKIKRILGQTH